MKSLFCFLMIAAFFFAGCENSSDRLEGNYAFPPTISFDKVYSKYLSEHNIWYKSIAEIDTFSIDDTVYIFIGERNRSDGYPCPANGVDRPIYLNTQNGDSEIFSLDSEPSFLMWADNLTPYIKILPIKTGIAEQNNGILEVHPKHDFIVAVYYSYWNETEVRDTVYLDQINKN